MKRWILRAITALVLVAPAIGSGAEAGPIWVAHRGGNVEADENTLKSYQTAARYKFDIIECDPRLTRDGVFVAMHDPTVDRTTAGQGSVADMTLDEIKSLRTRGGEQAPAIQEVLDFARSAGVGVYLDTKEKKDLSYLEKLTTLIQQNNMSDKVIVGLWNNKQLKWMHEHHPEMATCISWPWPAQTLGQAKKRGASWAGTLVPLATMPMIKSAHKQGLKVITMPINEAEAVRRKIEYGIDAIQTDNPRLRLQSAE